ncbi:acyltransferase family protein [Clavibacter phaseoli]|uniref:acyltransferase family protein n=1 Tax=Clavibacter phaseoli TaxID=1734031 RepID=UPI0015FD8C4F|nr:acyltransferase [Clavibacter phaseoli]MBM7389894.1 peptidoglycan/LPS O-acetylase OafA/YrhL [Clavibacter michiganensis]
MRNLPSLTGLRWIAAFVVFAYHVSRLGFLEGDRQIQYSSLVAAGGVGVSLFFMLSGFVLAWADRPGGSALAFWRRRFARVYPLHAVTLLVALLLAATLLPQIRTGSGKAVVANALLVSTWHSPWWQAGNPVSWSLVNEAFFYLVFPLLILPLRRASAAVLWALSAIALAILLAMPYLLPLFPGGLRTDVWPPARLPEFVLGVLVAMLMRRGAWRGPRLALPAALAVAGYVVSTANQDSRFALTGFTALGFALLLAALARRDIEGRPTFLASRRWVFLGEISFAFYLVHVLVMQSVVALWPDALPRSTAAGVVLALASLVIATLVAAALHRLVEVPAQRALAGKRRPPARPADPDPAPASSRP